MVNLLSFRLAGLNFAVNKRVYQVELKPRATRDLKTIDHSQARRVAEKIRLMKNDLAGEVKRLTNSTPEFRLRVGDYRILFEIEGDKVVVYRVRHRKDAYG
jgi:mRNA interferase RelE/StbE